MFGHRAGTHRTRPDKGVCSGVFSFLYTSEYHENEALLRSAVGSGLGSLRKQTHGWTGRCSWMSSTLSFAEPSGALCAPLPPHAGGVQRRPVVLEHLVAAAGPDLTRPWALCWASALPRHPGGDPFPVTILGIWTVLSLGQHSHPSCMRWTRRPCTRTA